MTAKRLLFASYHCYTDPSSGAAIATQDLLGLLAESHWQTRVVCGPLLDNERQESLRQLLVDSNVHARQSGIRANGVNIAVLSYQQDNIPITACVPQSPSPNGPNAAEGAAFLATYINALESFRPTVMLTYGGSWVEEEMIRHAAARGIKVVFALHNLSYSNARIFSGVDAILVPSHFAAAWYRDRLNLKCVAIPSPLDWDRVRCHLSKEGRYVTFVNPQPAKGVHLFAQIARQLSHDRPDIRFLVVEGRGRADWLARTGVDLSHANNLYVMANTPDPRDFLRVTRMLLTPSVCHETFCRVAAEALINGIPVLSSNRGALPEVVGDAGVVLEIPPESTSTSAPPMEYVMPWVESIVALWDDDCLNEEVGHRSRKWARKWASGRLSKEYDSFFSAISSHAHEGSREEL